MKSLIANFEPIFKQKHVNLVRVSNLQETRQEIIANNCYSARANQFVRKFAAI